MNQAQKDRFWSYINKDGRIVEYVGTPCWEWTRTKDKDGYGRFSLEANKYERAHRISFRIAFGELTEGLMVLHKCDNPSCVRPDHLFLGTARDNAIDASLKGRLAFGDRNHSRSHRNERPRGEKHGKHKLTEDNVRTIRILHSRGYSSKRLAEMFGVSHTPVDRILNGTAWTHVIDFASVDMMPVEETK